MKHRSLEAKPGNFPLSLHDDLGCHFGVNHAVVEEGTGFGERIGEAIVGIERLGFEYPRVADNDMRNPADPRTSSQFRLNHCKWRRPSVDCQWACKAFVPWSEDYPWI